MGAEVPAATERVHVVAPVGELDLASVDALRARLAARPGACELVVLDLRGLSFCDTSGIRLAVETMQQTRALGLGFAIVRGPAAVQRPFALARMEDRLPFFDDLARALGAR